MTKRIMTMAGLLLILLLILTDGVGAGVLLLSEKGRAASGGMFDLYEQNRNQGIPNYITEDFLVLAYCMTLNGAITDIEEKTLLPHFRSLVEGLAVAASKTDEPAGDNLDFLAVLSALLSGKDAPQWAADRKKVSEELARVREAKGLSRSELMLQTVDYSQFLPRGKYTRSEELGHYFRAMRYAGTILFPVTASAATGISDTQADRLTGQALAMAGLISKDEKLSALYASFESNLTWLFGPAEDLTLVDYVTAAQSKKETRNIRQNLLETARREGRQPEIIGGLVDVSRLEEGLTPADVLTGWRFLPQHFSPDSAAFQNLVHDRVGEYSGKEKKPFSLTMIDGKAVKGYPLSLELMAMFGSETASNYLAQAGEIFYQGYSEAAEGAREQLLRPAGLPSAHLRVIDYWLSRGQTDDLRRLNTALSFWTWHRYINILYAKQSYTVTGKGITMDNRERKTAWLEPAPELYLYLENLAGQFTSRFPSAIMESLRGILGRCGEIAHRELNEQPLTESEVSFLNSLDQSLLPLTGGKDGPIVVDVHTEPNDGQVLEEAIGWPTSVPIKRDGAECRGALFTYAEFKQPMDDRLTDEAWTDLLKKAERLEKMEFSCFSLAVPGVGK